MIIALSIILLLLGAQIAYHLRNLLFVINNYEHPVKKTKFTDEKIDDLEEIKLVKLDDDTLISSKNKIEL